VAVPSLDESQPQTAARFNRRTFLRRASLLTGTAALGLAGYSGLIETNEIEVRKLDIRVHRLGEAFDGFKIALLSDFHYGPYTGEREISSAVQKANALQPDVIALLGDFVSEPLEGNKRSGAKKAEPCAKVLSGLRSRLGSFAVLGNHDYTTDPEFVAEALRAHGTNVLRNSTRVFEQAGSRLSLMGLNDAIGAADLDQALKGASTADPKILLVHEPDYADYSSRFGIDVQFSGHSHGGQVRIPGIHPLWLPYLARKYYKGYYRVGQLQLYTNEGIGTIGVPFRFCSPPEVTLVTLRPA